MAQGCFITLEGGEGTGKSTQVTRLFGALAARGIEAIATREPGGSPAAEAIRTLLVDESEGGRWDPISETLLQFAARADHLRRTILPALERGVWVVSDRFADSTRAYQGSGLGVPRDHIETLYRMVMGDFVPNLTLILDLPVEIGLARAEERDAGRSAHYERLPRAFHENVRAAFLAIAARDPGRCAVLDARADADSLHEAVISVVNERLGLPGDG